MAKAAVGAPATRLAGLGWRTWLLLLDIVLNVAFAIHGPFHAIDWWAYMDQVDHIVSGERDYEAIEGRTGPLVYPGGHVWIHVALHYISDGGRRVALLQAIYGVLQALNAWLVSGIYEAAAPPGSRPWLLCGLTYVAVRTRNVFVNGLFNDCWQVTLAHLALHAAVVRGRPVAAAFLLSLAVSVKMSALLYAPGLAVVLLRARGPLGAAGALLGAAALQPLLGIPFLLHRPRSFLGAAFEFGRRFHHMLSYNWKFLPPDLFASRVFHGALLAGHLAALAALALRPGGWLGLSGLRRALLSRADHRARAPGPGPRWTAGVLVASNLVGVAFARSLHYSFFVWYQQTLPLGLALHGLPLPAIAGLGLVLELAWNQWSGCPEDVSADCVIDPGLEECDVCFVRRGASGVVAAAHVAVLLALLLRPAPADEGREGRENSKSGRSKAQ